MRRRKAGAPSALIAVYVSDQKRAARQKQHNSQASSGDFKD
jgi:hypothetical protein